MDKELLEKAQECADKYEYIGNIIFSPDWKGFAFAAKVNDKYIIVKDWVEGKEYDYIWVIKYSHNLKSFFFSAIKDWKRIMVRNWIESKGYEDIICFKYSPDWISFAFIAKVNNKYIIVKDWVESDEYDCIKDYLYSPDWKKFIFAVIEKWKHLLFRDWIKIGEYDEILSLKYSKNLKKLIVTAKTKWGYKQLFYNNNNNYMTHITNITPDSNQIPTGENKKIPTGKNKKIPNGKLRIKDCDNNEEFTPDIEKKLWEIYDTVASKIKTAFNILSEAIYWKKEDRQNRKVFNKKELVKLWSDKTETTYRINHYSDILACAYPNQQLVTGILIAIKQLWKHLDWIDIEKEATTFYNKKDIEAIREVLKEATPAPELFNLNTLMSLLYSRIDND